jgi:hypothetical protein
MLWPSDGVLLPATKASAISHRAADRCAVAPPEAGQKNSVIMPGSCTSERIEFTGKVSAILAARRSKRKRRTHDELLPTSCSVRQTLDFKG